jgi:gliding motility-associated-like protein
MVTFDAFINIPTAFTPNSDGLNDGFRPITKDVQTLELHVFNRWGEQVFYTTDPDAFWDGTYKNVPQELGVYTWWARATYADGSETFLKGNVTLIR